ncbi:MAG: hypothetical protein JW841_02785 [Deltaproteobacteria bacterium]|nr:hypothetical protein [Deltaproteobacteria bacterium]
MSSDYREITSVTERMDEIGNFLDAAYFIICALCEGKYIDQNNPSLTTETLRTLIGYCLRELRNLADLLDKIKPL